jgi:hypothetical protein
MAGEWKTRNYGIKTSHAYWLESSLGANVKLVYNDDENGKKIKELSQEEEEAKDEAKKR